MHSPGRHKVLHLDEKDSVSQVRREDHALLMAGFIRVIGVLGIPERGGPEHRECIGVRGIDRRVRNAQAHASAHHAPVNALNDVSRETSLPGLRESHLFRRPPRGIRTGMRSGPGESPGRPRHTNWVEKWRVLTRETLRPYEPG